MHYRTHFLVLSLSLLCLPAQAKIADFFQSWSESNAANRQAIFSLFTGRFDTVTTAKDTESDYTFDQLAGFIPDDVHEIVDIINNPDKYKRFGQVCPKGVLLYGPPGNGKTSIARAIAGETDAPFYAISGTEFMELYVGVGPQRVGQFFKKAYDAIDSGKYRKAILFIDEIDAVGGNRSPLYHDPEQRSTLDQILKEMDGFEQHPNIIVIGATNTPEHLDPALLRPGRFDRLVEIPYPDEKSRYSILEHYLNKIDHTVSEKKVVDVAEKASGLTSAELESIVKEASLYAIRANAQEVDESHIEQAFNKVKKSSHLRAKTR
jgi:cell division protease FtsH